ncbi:MAG TPA: Amuc_1102 family pilus-like protein, partial [Chthoniobacterales bacterium]
MNPLLPVVVLTTLSLLPASAQLAQGDLVEVTGVTVDYVTTPEFSFQFGPKGKKTKNREWLEIETTFNWQPRPSPSAPRFLDELTVNYYILLNNPGFRDPSTGGLAKATLLTGRSTLTAVAAGKGLKTVVYISPRTLDRFFDGKQPATAGSAVKEVSVAVTRGGQLVGYLSQGKFPPNWWNDFQPNVQGYVLNKNETPFAAVAWDYYEPLKAQQTPGGF